MTRNELFINAFNHAINVESNWNEDGVNWNFIDADCYDVVGSFMSGEKYVQMFEELAELYDLKYKNITTLADKKAYDSKVDAEYKELFGGAA